MSCLNFEYGERWLQEEIKRDSARLKQLEIERRMRLNKASKEKLKSQPRKVKFEDEWDPGIANRRHGGEARESRVRDNNMDSSKKKVSLFVDEFIRRFEEMFAEAYEQSKKRGSLEPSQSPNTSFCEPNQLKEEEKRAISKPPLEHKSKTDEIEEIEVTAEEGELWVEGVVPSLQEEEDEEIQREDIVQVQNIMHEAPKIAIDTSDIITEKGEEVQVESLDWKIIEVEHIDFIGVDNCNIHPNYQLANFFNKLRSIELSHGMKLDEFRVARSFKHRKYSKYLFSWHGRFELFQFALRMKREKYSKYLFYWHGRYQDSMWHSRINFVEEWVICVTLNSDLRTNPFQEEGNDAGWHRFKLHGLK